MEYTIYLCPKDECGLIMTENGTITLEAPTVGTSETKPTYGCPEHGGHYFKSGLYFLADADNLPE